VELQFLQLLYKVGNVRLDFGNSALVVFSGSHFQQVGGIAHPGIHRLYGGYNFLQ